MLFERLDVTSNWKLSTLPISLNFNSFMAKDQREELVCSIIARSENAALRNSNNNKDDSLS